MKYLLILLFFANTILAENQIIEALKTRIVQVNSGDSVCTGTILNNHEVLTSAHCFIEKGHYQDRINLSHLRTYGTITTLTGLTQTVVVSKIGKDLIYNDLALLDAGIIRDGDYSTLPISSLSLDEDGWVIDCASKEGRKCSSRITRTILTGYNYYNSDKNYLNIDPTQLFFLKLQMLITSIDNGSPVFDQYGNLSGIIVRTLTNSDKIDYITEDKLSLNSHSILRFYNNP